MNNKHKHLEFIQSAITRMATNMFYLRGWAITILAALLALFIKTDTPHYVFCYLTVILCTFWISDGYFLGQERLFRDLYDDVRMKNEIDIDFSMNTKPYKQFKRNSMIVSMFSFTLLIFYSPLVVIATFITLLLK